MKITKFQLLFAALFLLITGKLVWAQKKQIHLQDAALKEISGIASSKINKNIFYVHNDSGDTSRFFAISPSGQLKSTFYFRADQNHPNVNVIDCEDIAVGPGSAKGKSYIYLGDIGDNGSTRKFITIYRFLEPVITEDKSFSIKSQALHLKYPDGAHDAETLMVDPIEKLFYIVTKREDSVSVYTAPLHASFTDTILLTKRCKIHFQGLPLLKWITAGDISADGSQILLRSYQKVYYWKRQKNEPVWKTLQRKPTELPCTAEKQSEAIGFTADGKNYYSTGEGKNAPLYEYQTPE